MVFSGCLPSATQNDDAAPGDDNNNPGAAAAAIPPEELNTLRKIFDAFDANKDGFLTLEELCEWMKKLGLRLTREDLLQIVRSCDWDSDGRLDFNEFVALSQSLENKDGSRRSAADDDAAEGSNNTDDDDPHAEMKAAFRVFDKDGDGLISPSELRATLSELGLLPSSTNLSRIQSMIKRVDTDGDGEVNFSEFQTMMKGK